MFSHGQIALLICDRLGVASSLGVARTLETLSACVFSFLFLFLISFGFGVCLDGQITDYERVG